MNLSKSGIRLTALSLGLLTSSVALGAGQVSTILISEQPATPFSYTMNGVTYDWGRGSNQIIEGFVTNGITYTYSLQANEVLIQRDDIPGIATGEPCGIFVESLSLTDSQRVMAADFPHDGSEKGNCDLKSMLESRILNRGLVDAFSNVKPDAKNIERLDYVHYFGTAAPLQSKHLEMAGHIVAEKSGNNPIKIAAITSLDIFGQPDQYGPLVLVGATGCADPSVCFGNTNLQHDYSFLQNEFDAPQTLPVETERTRENVGMAFISTADLGLAAGQRYFGVSLFADDVDDAIHDLVDPTSFPDDTSDPFIVAGDDADIYGGLTGYFISDDMSTVVVNLFLDVDGDGVPDADEAGISDISVSIFLDVNGNGILDAEDTQLGDTLVSNIDGMVVFPGLADGTYLIVLDEADPEIPEGLELVAGTNPHPLVVAGTSPDPVSFSFISADGPGNPGDPNNPGGPGNPGDPNNPDGPNDGTPPLGDDATAAIPDAFQVMQGRPSTLDVLANDIDGAGAGLTIVSVSASDNATITVTDDNRVLYEPEFSYFTQDAPDTFVYTIEDGDGTRRTGNVSVTVLSLAELTLETGVNGSGIGQLSNALLLILSLAGLLRLRRRVARCSDANRSAP